MWVYYHFVNRDRAHGKEDDKIAGMSEEDIQEMGRKALGLCIAFNVFFLGVSL